MISKRCISKDKYEFLGLLVIVFGSIISWISSLLTYRFGRLIDNTDKLVYQNRTQTNIELDIDSSTQKRTEQLNDLREDGLITENCFYIMYTASIHALQS